jgi:methionine-rich copper-binding protein CopC
VPASPLKPGVYSVKWHAVTADTHRTQGAFTFTVR